MKSCLNPGCGAGSLCTRCKNRLVAKKAMLSAIKAVACNPSDSPTKDLSDIAKIAASPIPCAYHPDGDKVGLECIQP